MSTAVSFRTPVGATDDLMKSALSIAARTLGLPVERVVAQRDEIHSTLDVDAWFASEVAA